MKLAEQVYQLCEEISQSDLKRIEVMLDKLFAAIGVDVEFTKHFHDRLNDSRNGKPITLDELAKIYADVFRQYGPQIAKLPDEAEAVMKDVSTNINIPFVLNYDPKAKKIDMVAKTVMRKKDFKSSTKFYKVS